MIHWKQFMKFCESETFKSVHQAIYVTLHYISFLERKAQTMGWVLFEALLSEYLPSISINLYGGLKLLEYAHEFIKKRIVMQLSQQRPRCWKYFLEMTNFWKNSTLLQI